MNDLTKRKKMTKLILTIGDIDYNSDIVIECTNEVTAQMLKEVLEKETTNIIEVKIEES